MAEEGIDKVKAADAAVDAPPAPAPATPTEPATPPVAQGPAVLDTLQLQAILSHPQIQEHIAASQKPIQSARDKERQRANAAEQAANLSDEDRTTLLDRQSVLNDAITFYSEVKGTPKEDLEDVRDLKELMGRVRLIKASATMVDPSKVDPALQTAALKAAASGTANALLAPANGQGPQRSALSDDEVIKVVGDGGGTPEDLKRAKELVSGMGIRLN